MFKTLNCWFIFMKFKVEQNSHPNLPKYPSDDYQLAFKFAKKLHSELGSFLKAAILFGSAARGQKPLYGERDIDVLCIIDDLTITLSKEVIQSYRVITENVAAKVTHRLHITTLKLTTFWEYVRQGDPIAVNMLRDGIPLHDSGFFQPAQQLLFKGRIRPSRESIWTYFTRAPATLQNADWHILQATLDLYWAVVDAAHAAMMQLGDVPPTPGHLSDMINDRLVKRGVLPAKYSKMMANFYDLQKKIIHRRVQKITGKQYDDYKKHAEDFVDKMQKIVRNA